LSSILNRYPELTRVTAVSCWVHLLCVHRSVIVSSGRSWFFAFVKV